MKQNNNQIMHEIYSNPKYAGMHVVAIGGKIFATKTGKRAAEIFAEQTKKYPGQVPMGTYVPGDEALILIWK